VRNKWKYEVVHQLFIDFKKACDSVRKKVLYNILSEIDILIQLVKLIKMCLSETYNRVQVSSYLSDIFPIKNGLKQRNTLPPLLFNFALDMLLGGFR
jgi:hypothetical protein